MTRSQQSQTGADPGDFVAAIPAVLRFFPTVSIVLAAFTTDPLTLECVLRADLPTPRTISVVADDLLVVASNQEIDFVNLLVIGGDTANRAHLPHRNLIGKLTRMLNEHGVDLDQALWVERIEHGLPWRSYVDPTRTGRIADPAKSPMASGTPICASRKELAAQLASDPRPQLNRRARLLRALPPVRPDQAITLIRQTVDQIGGSGSGELVLDDETLVRVGQALTNGDVRDASLKLALTEQVEPAERLWALLTRALPRSIVAYPASLLAVCVYLRGEGTLAHIAIETALAADPDVRLAKTLRKFFCHAWTPDQFGKALAEAARRAEANEEIGSHQHITKATDELGEFRLSLHFELTFPPQALHRFVHLSGDLQPHLTVRGLDGPARST